MENRWQDEGQMTWREFGKTCSALTVMLLISYVLYGLLSYAMIPEGHAIYHPLWHWWILPAKRWFLN